MAKKVRQQMARMRKAGYSPIDLALVREKARKESQGMMQEVFDKTLLLHLYVTCDILANEYWEKSAKKAIPKFVDKYITLLSTVNDDLVDYAEIKKVVEDVAGLNLQFEWENKNENHSK